MAYSAPLCGAGYLPLDLTLRFSGRRWIALHVTPGMCLFFLCVRTFWCVAMFGLEPLANPQGGRRRIRFFAPSMVGCTPS